MTGAERVFIGLGSNLGDSRAVFASAFEALEALPGTEVVARSALYRSAPVEATGADYLNAVAELATNLEPADLLSALHRIEHAAGRERPYRHAPRTLDLDLLLHGERSIVSDRLQVPHPRLHRRAFVLVPLLQIAPDLRHPALGLLADHLPGVADQAVVKIA